MEFFFFRKISQVCYNFISI